MNPDSNAPLTPTPPNPATLATPPLTPAPAPAPEAAVPLTAPTPAPEMAPLAASPLPEAPTFDPSLLQEAIADVPKEATENPLPDASATPLDSLGSASPFANVAAPSADFTTAPSADLSPAPADGVSAGTPDASFADAPKSTPSVAFNDPAAAPDAPAPGTEPKTQKPGTIDLSQISDKVKKLNPIILIVGGSAIIIIGLVLLIAFAL
ncbi:hypothetical protein IJI72_03385 [Candidatus Saccharibacteria bacterium]|nr:hypothetical protein [Candidatus Saccharibacteria bacterium]